jgi:hypothetical protein
MRIGSGPATSLVPLSGFSTATAANTAATSSTGCIRTGGNRTDCPSVRFRLRDGGRTTNDNAVVWVTGDHNAVDWTGNPDGDNRRQYVRRFAKKKTPGGVMRPVSTSRVSAGSLPKQRRPSQAQLTQLAIRQDTLPVQCE